ncbi:glutaminase A [Hamadaea tsunoensis]|uniref:glutaminase A n=1 Tax=Hamadaea tsunoensis TaxID=53368 RepID=UPI000412D825|nr:glutaminase A [Hamadaea tsunoensis]
MQAILDSAYAATRPWFGSGRLSPDVATLAEVDERSFGIAVATVHGEVFGAGDWLVPFSAQSITKAFALALVVSHDGAVSWGRMGRRPPHSLSALDAAFGVPRNPFLHAGALVVVDRLLAVAGGAACQAVLDLIRSESGNPGVELDKEIVADELEHGHRNTAIAQLVAAFGNLRHPIGMVLEHYVGQSAVAASCRDLALAGLFLARRGVRADGSRLLSEADTRRINATMLTSGLYGASADLAHRIGLPATSGIGGGILAIAPGRGAICAWGPGLDRSGNSIAAIEALDHFTSMSGWSVF